MSWKTREITRLMIMTLIRLDCNAMIRSTLPCLYCQSKPFARAAQKRWEQTSKLLPGAVKSPNFDNFAPSGSVGASAIMQFSWQGQFRTDKAEAGPYLNIETLERAKGGVWTGADKFCGDFYCWGWNWINSHPICLQQSLLAICHSTMVLNSLALARMCL